MNIIFNFSLPTARYDYDSLRWFERDAKRIRKGITWDSGVYQKTEDGKYIIEIQNKDKLENLWVVEMIRDRATGRTKVTPIGKVRRFVPMGNDLYQYTLVGSDNTYKKL